MMWCRLSDLERTVRSLVALPIITWGYYLRDVSKPWSQILFWGGMYFAITAVITWCPFRGLFQKLKRACGKG